MATFEVIWTTKHQPNTGAFKVFRCGNKAMAAKFVEEFLLPPNSRILNVREVVGVEPSSDENFGFSELTTKTKQLCNDVVKAPTADAYQIGGNHYKDLPIQPWHVMEVVLSHEEFIGFLKGNYIKYAMRHKSPEDVEKAKHYKEKLREVQNS